MKRVVFVNQCFFPDYAASAQALADVAQRSVEMGYRVTVVAARRSYTQPQKEYTQREVWNGIEIERISCSLLRGSGRWVRILNSCVLMAAFSWKLLTLRDVARVVALTSPPLLVFVCAVVSRVRRVPLAHWALDINPEQVFRAGWLGRTSLAGRLLSASLRCALQQCETVVTLDEYMRETLLSYGASPERVVVLPMWAGHIPSDNDEQEAEAIRHKSRVNNAFVVMYAGNLSICHPIETLLEAALLLRGYDRIAFVLAGGGARLPELESFCEQHTLTNITVLPYQPREKLGGLLSAADLHVVTMGDAYVGVVHPSKVYGILAAQRPFVYVGPEQSPIADIQRECGIDGRFSHGEAEALARFIEDAAGCSLAEREAVGKRVGMCAERFRAEEVMPRVAQCLVGDY